MSGKSHMTKDALYTFAITVDGYDQWILTASSHNHAISFAWHSGKYQFPTYLAFCKAVTCTIDAPFGVSPAFPAEKVKAVKELARLGYSAREITRRLGTHHHNVRPIVAKLEAEGQLPTHCPCGQLRGRGHINVHCSHSTAIKKGRFGPHKSPLSRAQIQEMYDLAASGLSNRKISQQTGRCLMTVNKYIKKWMAKRAEQGLVNRSCLCGRPARHPGGCRKNSPSMGRERIRIIKRWAEQGLSASEMKRRTRDLSPNTGVGNILKYARPVWERMEAEGKLCGCGKRLGHPTLCAATWDTDFRVRGAQPIPAQLQQRISTALLNGESVVAIRRRMEVSEKKVLRVFGEMPEQDRKRRSLKVRQRLKMGEREHSQTVMQRIVAALPGNIEAHIRDEVVSELYLAVLQGDVSIQDIEKRARQFVGKAFSTWCSAFGPSSLNKEMGESGNLSLIDSISDETFLQGLDDVELGGVW